MAGLNKEDFARLSAQVLGLRRKDLESLSNLVEEKLEKRPAAKAPRAGKKRVEPVSVSESEAVAAKMKLRRGDGSVVGQATGPAPAG